MPNEAGIFSAMQIWAGRMACSIFLWCDVYGGFNVNIIWLKLLIFLKKGINQNQEFSLYCNIPLHRDSGFLDYFLTLIAKNQHDFLYEYFSSERGLAVRSKERFLMIWYALVSEMKTQYPLEYLRIPSELQPTVIEILDKVALLRHQLQPSVSES